jgi:deazaflavin-dependent oxidoreductase (nitroreductase family)
MRKFLVSDDAARAMYRGGRGNAVARRFARVWRWVFAAGLFPRRWVTLEVPGRRSGKPTKFPLGMADVAHRWYLVSMLGEDCNWVRNVRAVDGRVVLRRRTARHCQLVEVPPAQRAPILRRYVQKVPGGRPHIPVSRDAPIADFEAIAALYPVFEVTEPRG